MDFTEISNAEELVAIANEMKMSAARDKYSDEGQADYSKTIEEANFRANNPEVREIIKNLMDDTIRVLMMMDNEVVTTLESDEGTKSIKGFPVTISLSAEIIKEGEEIWHLSMSCPMLTEAGPSIVPDKYVTAIVQGFFDEYEEFDTGSAYTNIRHFKAEKKSPV